jgi:hypothetical protein
MERGCKARMWLSEGLPPCCQKHQQVCGPGRALPLHSCSSSCRVVLSDRHPTSTWGVKQNFSRMGTICSCCRRGATDVCSREMRAPPATVMLRQWFTTTLATEGTDW